MKKTKAFQFLKQHSDEYFRLYVSTKMCETMDIYGSGSNLAKLVLSLPSTCLYQICPPSAY